MGFSLSYSLSWVALVLLSSVSLSLSARRSVSSSDRKVEAQQNQTRNQRQMSSQQFTFNHSVGIYNGDDAQWSQYPYIVSIRHFQYFDSHCCGGAIVSLDPPIILTAAHCINGCYIRFYEDAVPIVIGNTYTDARDGFEYGVAQWVQNPQWDGNIDDYDVGLVLLDRPITQPSAAQTVVLEESDPCCASNEDLRVLGYGTVAATQPFESLQLQTALEGFVTQSTCTSELSSAPRSYTITNRMMCVKDKGVLKRTTTCFGDSGSPVMKDNSRVVVGLVSFGVSEGMACDASYPQMNTNVGNSDINAWIKSTMADWGA